MPRDPIRSASAERTRRRIRTLAMRQLAAGGPESLSLKAIATDLGVSGPALYRYYRSRSEVLAALVDAAYRDLAVELARARSVSGAVAAYRRWALEAPHRYRLLYGPPLPGFDAHRPDLVAASQLAMNELLRVLDAGDDGSGAWSATHRAEVEAWLETRGSAFPAHVGHAGIQAWAHLHGLVLLEINGVYASMGIDPAALYAEVGRPAPR